MVAETHSHNPDLRFDHVVTYLVEVLGGLDVVTPGVTLGDCGFDLTLDLSELADLLGEEFSERTLGTVDLDDFDGDTLVTEFVAAMYPHLVEGT